MTTMWFWDIMASIAFYQATSVDRYRVIIALKVSKMPKGESTGSKPKPEACLIVYIWSTKK